MLVVKNKDFLKTNSNVHSFNTRSHYDLYIPAANLAVFQKAVWYSGIKIYNQLPPTLKQLSYDVSKFKADLKRFLLQTLFAHCRSITAGNKDLCSYYYILTILQTIALLFNYYLIQINYYYIYVLSYMLYVFVD